MKVTTLIRDAPMLARVEWACFKRESLLHKQNQRTMREQNSTDMPTVYNGAEKKAEMKERE